MTTEAQPTAPERRPLPLPVRLVLVAVLVAFVVVLGLVTRPRPGVHPLAAFPSRIPIAPKPLGPETLSSAVAAWRSGPLRLGDRVYTVSDFAQVSYGLAVPRSIPGITGSGVAKSVIELLPGSSTKRSQVPQTKGATNPLSILRVTGSPVLSGFLLQGTDQGHEYNGLRVQDATNARVTDVAVSDVPGSNDVPPGETFAINDFRSNGSVYRDVSIDGGGVGASLLAFNSSSDVTVIGGSFHGSRFAHGVTFWQTHGIRIQDTDSYDNHVSGYNFERVSGTVTMVRPTMHGDVRTDIRIASDRASAVFDIIDPVFDGPKLRILIDSRYLGKAEAQRASDIHVIVHGKDVTSTVASITYR